MTNHHNACAGLRQLTADKYSRAYERIMEMCNKREDDNVKRVKEDRDVLIAAHREEVQRLENQNRSKDKQIAQLQQQVFELGKQQRNVTINNTIMLMSPDAAKSYLEGKISAGLPRLMQILQNAPDEVCRDENKFIQFVRKDIPEMLDKENLPKELSNMLAGKEVDLDLAGCGEVSDANGDAVDAVVLAEAQKLDDLVVTELAKKNPPAAETMKKLLDDN